MKKKLPARPELFKARCERIIEHCREKNAYLMQIPPMANLECQMVVEAYYGSKFKAAKAILRQAIAYRWQGLKTGMTMWICDRMGWTKVWHIPKSEQWKEHWRRHGWKCPCIWEVPPNPTGHCDLNCIEDSIPNWFKRLFRQEK